MNLNSSEKDNLPEFDKKRSLEKYLWNSVKRTKKEKPSTKVQKSGVKKKQSNPFDPGRDPIFFSDVLKKISATPKWKSGTNLQNIKINWKKIIGASNAEHIEVISLTSKTLYIKTDSTAWATQIKYFEKNIIENIDKQVAQNIVSKVVVLGPEKPSWRKGYRHISGRGPRDTYG